MRGHQWARAIAMACVVVSSIPSAANTKRQASGQPVQVQMRNVDLHLDEDSVLRIRHLRGELDRTRPGTPPVFDDKNSFTLAIDSADIAIGVDALSRLINRHLSEAGDSPISDIRLGVEGSRLTIHGTAHKGIAVPFAVTAEPRVDNGTLRLHPTSVKALGIPSEGLFSFFHLSLEKLLHIKQPGMRFDGNDLLLDPTALLPPPRAQGHLQAFRVEGDQVVQQFGPGRKAPLRPPDARSNYMYYRGGILRFGKLTMTDADMELIDQHSADPFDFFQEHYVDQLVAGYSKNTRARGLKVYMPDYRTVASKQPTPAKPPD